METERDSLEDKGKPKKGSRPLSMLDRSIQAAVADQRELGAENDPARQELPVLWDWMTRTKASRDHVITGAKLVVVAAPGGFVVQLIHADLTYTFETTTEHLSGLLTAMEAWLNDPKCIPKQWGKKQPTARRRKPIS